MRNLTEEVGGILKVARIPQLASVHEMGTEQHLQGTDTLDLRVFTLGISHESAYIFGSIHT